MVERLTPDLLGVLGDVKKDLGDVIDQLDQLGPLYARLYLEHHYGPARCPQKPRGMHPLAAAIVRDLVLERATVERLDAIEARPRRDAQRRRSGA